MSRFARRCMKAEFVTTVEEAFRWARIHAVRHMTACERADLRWAETSITEIITARAAEAVTVVPFTQSAEALSGADWIWWWVDGTGAYGMLVQAKRVAVARGKWRFDFNYRSRTGSQRATLMSTASRFGLLPVYALYLGTGDYRGWEPCPDGHRSGRCLPCVQRSISLMPALLADEALVDNSRSTYERSVALEELCRPNLTGPPLLPGLRNRLAPELSDFLKTRQVGTRAVTRSMIDRVLRVRAAQFSAISSPEANVRDGDHDRLGPVFSNLPGDTGHWGLNYLQHTLNPLRQTPPAYVLEIDSGEFNDEVWTLGLPENVAGIVVVRLHQSH